MDTSRRNFALAIATGGMDGGSNPSLIGPDQYALGINLTNRGNLLKTRPPWGNIPLSFHDAETEARWTGKFQGAILYQGQSTDQTCWLVSRGGKLFRISKSGIITEVTPVLLVAVAEDFTVPAIGSIVNVKVNTEIPFQTGDSVFINGEEYTVTNRQLNELELTNVNATAAAVVTVGTPIYFAGNIQAKQWQTGSANDDLVYMFQAEIWVIVCRGQFKTVFFDGNSSRLSGFKEIPPCVLGAYGWGRIWYTVNDYRSYGAGDIVYGDSGTIFYRRKDAILKVTENDFLNEGGLFTAPQNAGPITSMQFLETQDTSLGMGVLLIGTTNGVFSNNAPVDRTTWKDLTYPIQTISLLDYGPQGPRSTVSVNADMWHRALDGVRTFIVARRNFGQPGNTPVSFEISNILNQDTQFLLRFGSAVQFDNRLLMTVSPHRTDVGIRHKGLAVVNFDLVSTLRGKAPMAWEGLYTGLDVLQVLKGTIDGVERGFIFSANSDGEIELWEMFKDGTYDTHKVDGEVVSTPIQTVVESRLSNFEITADDMMRLRMGMIWLDDIVDTVSITVKWRPDELPTWFTWKTFTICANVSQCTPPDNCQVWKPKSRGYVARYTLPQPDDPCTEVGKLARLGFQLQFRIEITGHARLKMFRATANVQNVPMEGSDACTNPPCQVINGCKIGFFNYDSNGN